MNHEQVESFPKFWVYWPTSECVERVCHNGIYFDYVIVNITIDMLFPKFS